jgi:hypothetical protein
MNAMLGYECKMQCLEDQTNKLADETEDEFKKLKEQRENKPNIPKLNSSAAETFQEGIENATKDKNVKEENAFGDYLTKESECTQGDDYRACLERADKSGKTTFHANYEDLTEDEKAVTDAKWERLKNAREDKTVLDAIPGTSEGTTEQRKTDFEEKVKLNYKDENGNQLAGSALKLAVEQTLDKVGEITLGVYIAECEANVTAGTKTKADCQAGKRANWEKNNILEGSKNDLKNRMKYDEDNKKAAAKLAQENTATCKDEAAADASKLAECARTARKSLSSEIADKNYEEMNYEEKAEFEITFKRAEREAGAATITEALKANKAKGKEAAEKAAFDIWVNGETTVYDDDEDAKIAFQKVKSLGIQRNLIGAYDTCARTSKSSTECDVVAKTEFADSNPGLDMESTEFKILFERQKKESFSDKAVSSIFKCKNTAGTNATELANCKGLSKREFGLSLGNDYDAIMADTFEKAKFETAYELSIQKKSGESLAEDMATLKDLPVKNRTEQALINFKARTTKSYPDTPDGKKEALMDFEKLKRTGTQAKLAIELKLCNKTRAACEADSEMLFADSMGFETGSGADLVNLKATYNQFKAEGAGLAAVDGIEACRLAGTAADCDLLAKNDAAAALGETIVYEAMTTEEKALFDTKFARMTTEASAKKVTEAMRINKGLGLENRTAAALDVFKKSQTKDYGGDEKEAKMDFEKFKRIGAQAGLGEKFKDCLAAEKNDCATEAQTSFADSMGLIKPTETDVDALLNFNAQFEQFKYEGAGLAAVKKTSSCAEAAGNNATKRAQCADLAKIEAATALGYNSADFDALAGVHKAKFDAEFELMTKEAGAKKLSEAMRANKGKSKEERVTAALEVFQQTQTKTYNDVKDAMMDFENAKRVGAQTGLADTFKDCLTAEKDDCADVAEDSFSDFTGLTNRVMRAPSWWTSRRSSSSSNLKAPASPPSRERLLVPRTPARTPRNWGNALSLPKRRPRRLLERTTTLSRTTPSKRPSSTPSLSA